MPTARYRRTLLAAAAAASTLFTVAATASEAAPAGGSSGRQQQTCPIPVVGADADTVTLTGPATLSPPNGRFVPYTLTAAETPGEQGDHLPHGITLSYSVNVGGAGSPAAPAQSSDAKPPSGMKAGDFSVPVHFALRALRPGSGNRIYTISWTATFDGGPHTCSSSDSGEHPFTVTVSHDRRH